MKTLPDDEPPSKETPAGPLVAMLVILTVVSGVVDAISYLALGHVFAANMTGNVVILGFSLAGAPGLSALSSFVALVAFLVGAVIGGRLGRLLDDRRRSWLLSAIGIELGCVLATTIGVATGLLRLQQEGELAMITLLAIGMGVQSATARRLAVPGLTTTVLTLTLTGLAADSPLGGGAAGTPWRHMVAVAAMLAGAAVGAMLVLDVAIVAPLILIVALLVTSASLVLYGVA